ncbi:MAG: HNH endonuclease [Limnothrix sp.]
MKRRTKEELATLYNARDIQELWYECRKYPVIKHPKLGWISPHDLRAICAGKPCPFCGKKMVQGQEIYATKSKEEAIIRGYQYVDKEGQKRINYIKTSGTYFHPNYVSLDHIINKARCPEMLFDYDNLQGICFRCNSEKGDDNNYEAKKDLDFIKSMAAEALKRYTDND